AVEKVPAAHSPGDKTVCGHSPEHDSCSRVLAVDCLVGDPQQLGIPLHLLLGSSAWAECFEGRLISNLPCGDRKRRGGRAELLVKFARPVAPGWSVAGDRRPQ